MIFQKLDSFYKAMIPGIAKSSLSPESSCGGRRSNFEEYC